MLSTFFSILGWSIYIYLFINVVYMFILAIAGRFRPAAPTLIPTERKKIAVLIPSYKEDNIIVDTARKAKQHDYPADRFEVFLAADKLQPETIAQLRAIPVQVLEVQFEIGSKARSLNKLLNWIPDNTYDIGIILDADNVMESGCLEKVNAAFQRGFKAVQCHRMAKNLNTPVAVLDALSEEVNNHFFRQGTRALGLSSSTIGSGMAFEFNKIREIYNKPGILGNPACDREVDFELMKADITIEYLAAARVLDEKVSTKQVYEGQRTRWFESQIIHLRLFFDKKQGHLPKTINFFNKLFLNLIPPRLLFLMLFILLFLMGVISYATGWHFMVPHTNYWMLLIGLFLSAYLIAMPGSFYSRSTVSAFLHLPLLLVSVLKAVLRMNVSRKEFIHTPKSFTQKVQ